MQIIDKDELIDLVKHCPLFYSPFDCAGLADWAAFEAGQENAVAQIVELLEDIFSKTE
jgi:hypothetical protein